MNLFWHWNPAKYNFDNIRRYHAWDSDRSICEIPEVFTHIEKKISYSSIFNVGRCAMYVGKYEKLANYNWPLCYWVSKKLWEFATAEIKYEKWDAFQILLTFYRGYYSVFIIVFCMLIMQYSFITKDMYCHETWYLINFINYLTNLHLRPHNRKLLVMDHVYSLLKIAKSLL